MVFWYPLKIPFVNWVMSSMWLAHFRLQNVAGANPLMVTQRRPNWVEQGSLRADIAAELGLRAARRHYSVPIQVSYSMRMMTPARRSNFVTNPCPTYP